jgi:rod shape determining protein RodA
MSLAEPTARGGPSGVAAKLVALQWPLILLISAVAGTGFLMLYSVAGGALEPWSRPQMIRFGVGMAGMMVIAMIPIRFWRMVSPLAYVIALALLVLVEIMGEIGMGAQRWIDLGPVQLQPSELMKVALVMALAAYYHWLPAKRVSHPFWVLLPLLLILVPTALVLKQPDLGTALLLLAGGGAVMFLAGLSLWYFAAAIASGVGLVTVVLRSQGTSWQLLEDYQFRRIFTFLDPSADPLGAPTTSPRPRSPWVRAGSRGGVSCRAPRAG